DAKRRLAQLFRRDTEIGKQGLTSGALLAHALLTPALDPFAGDALEVCMQCGSDVTGCVADPVKGDLGIFGWLRGGARPCYGRQRRRRLPIDGDAPNPSDIRALPGRLRRARRPESIAHRVPQQL